jgi:hypothetical protein
VFDLPCRASGEFIPCPVSNHLRQDLQASLFPSRFLIHFVSLPCMLHARTIIYIDLCAPVIFGEDRQAWNFAVRLNTSLASWLSCPLYFTYHFFSHAMKCCQQLVWKVAKKIQERLSFSTKNHWADMCVVCKLPSSVVSHIGYGFLIALLITQITLAIHVYTNTAHKLYTFIFYFPLYFSITRIEHLRIEKYSHRREGATEFPVLHRFS